MPMAKSQRWSGLDFAAARRGEHLGGVFLAEAARRVIGAEVEVGERVFS